MISGIRSTWFVLTMSLVIFLGSAVLIFRQFNPSDFILTWNNADKAWLVVALIAAFLKIMIHAFRWKSASHAQNVNLPSTFFMKSVLQLKVLEFVVPLPDAEDVIRMIQLKVRNVDLGTAISILVVDRLTGVSVLTIFFAFSCYAIPFGTPETRLAVSLSLIPLLLLLVLGLRNSVKLQNTVNRKLWGNLVKLGLLNPNQKLFQLEGKINNANKYKYATLLFTCIQVLSESFVLFSLLRAFGVSLSFSHVIGFVPLCTFSLVLPISYNGLGLYEGALIFLLMLLKVPELTAVTIAVAHFQLTLVILGLSALSVIFGNDPVVSLIRSHPYNVET